jgi:hypothetical protein
MTNYIITEEQLKKLVKNGVSHASEQIAYTVLSNPLPEAAPKGRRSTASFAGVPPSKREFEIQAAVLDEQEPSYEDLVDFARWTQTFWKNGIDIMRRNQLVIKSDEPMEKLAFTFYSHLCEIDAKVSHLFEEGYGDTNYKDDKVILVDLLKYPNEQDIRKDEREKVLDELDTWCTPEDNELDRPAKHKGDYIQASGRLRKKIQLLRTKPEEK